ncbi:hypothetical protein BGX26_012930 [Mortierella sp. AD094]|nr:hypothetical protein BGX26_012930 [Mortierella sp. AD094]
MVTYGKYPVVLAKVKFPSSEEVDREANRQNLPNEAKKALDTLAHDGSRIVEGTAASIECGARDLESPIKHYQRRSYDTRLMKILDDDI